MTFEWFHLPVSHLAVLMICGLMIGTAKGGIAGTGLMAVPILAHVFGGRVSTGLLLPMLIIADVYAVRHYRRHSEWKHILRVMPWAVAGILVGVWVGMEVSDLVFKRIMAVVIFFGISVMLWRDLQKNSTIPGNRWFAPVSGTAGGFATMMGNAAGPIMSLYLLVMRLPKLNFIGTAAWFFFLMNLIKVPFHVFFWKTISWESAALNLMMAPAILAGVWLGIKIVKVIPEKAYRILVIASTLAASALLLK